MDLYVCIMESFLISILWIYKVAFMGLGEQFSYKEQRFLDPEIGFIPKPA